MPSQRLVPAPRPVGTKARKAIRFRTTTGAITIIAASATLVLKRARRRQLVRASNKSASAQKKTNSIALARSQHDAPTSAPAPKAQPTLSRLVANNNIQVAPRMIQLVGESANGT